MNTKGNKEPINGNLTVPVEVGHLCGHSPVSECNMTQLNGFLTGVHVARCIYLTQGFNLGTPRVHEYHRAQMVIHTLASYITMGVPCSHESKESDLVVTLD